VAITSDSGSIVFGSDSNGLKVLILKCPQRGHAIPEAHTRKKFFEFFSLKNSKRYYSLRDRHTK